jgi:hypothetical protein
MTIDETMDSRTKVEVVHLYYEIRGKGTYKVPPLQGTFFLRASFGSRVVMIAKRAKVARTAQAKALRPSSISFMTTIYGKNLCIA